MNENQVGVILEEVRDMFKTLAEGQRIKSFVIAADNSFNNYESRIKALEKKCKSINIRQSTRAIRRYFLLPRSVFDFFAYIVNLIRNSSEGNLLAGAVYAMIC